MRRVAAALVMFLLLVPLVPVARGDGVAIVERTLHDVLRENRQLALVDVHDDYEILHLFLSVVSLDPGKNVTILIPLRTMPTGLNVTNSSDAEFYGKYGLYRVMWDTPDWERGERDLRETYLNALFGLSVTQLVPMGIYGPVFWAIFAPAVGSGSSSGGHYTFKTGDTIDVYNLSTSDDVRMFEEEHNVSLPDSVKKILGKYEGFYAMLVHARTRAPIDEEKYRILQERCPRSMEALQEYVKTHPRIRIKAMEGFAANSRIVSMEDSRELMSTFKSEAGKNGTLWDYFYRTILSIYGYGEARGMEITVKLPLYKGQAYFPLGTSPSWNASGQIRVFFRVPDDKELHPNDHSYEFVHYNGSFYYYWNYDGQLPDHDIEAYVAPWGNSALIDEKTSDLEKLAVSYSGIIGYSLAMSTLFAIWILLTFIAMLMWGGRRAARRWKGMLLIAVLGFTMSLFLGAPISALMALSLVKAEKEKYGITANSGYGPAVGYTALVSFVLFFFVFFAVYMYLA